MKIRSVSYLTKEGVKNLWANRLMTAASVGVLMACMVLIGLAILISMNVNKALGELEQQNVIMAYFNDKNSVLYGQTTSEEATSSENSSSTESTSSDASSQETSSKTDVTGETITDDEYLIHNKEEALALCDKLSKLDNVAKVEYVSSEDGLESMKEGPLEQYDEYFQLSNDKYGNPLSDAARITLEDMSKFDETLKAIEGTKGVDAVRSHRDIANKITALKNGIGIAGVWIISILLIISLVIVSNTIRVTMYSRKLEIGIMKAVGATNAFIRLPFVIEGITIGMIAAALSTGILYFCYRVAMEAISNVLATMTTIKFIEVLPYIVVIFLGIGILSGIIGSVIMISKYLRKEGSEFTAI